MESMACKVPNLLPNNAAFGEWALGSAMLYNCDGIFAQVNQLNTIHLVPAKSAAIEGLHTLYSDAKLRKQIGIKGYNLVTEERFTWKAIAQDFSDTMRKYARTSSEKASQEIIK